MNKRLNVRLLLRLGAVSLVLLLGIHLVHGFQIARQARSFRAQGEEALRQQDYGGGVLYLGRYLALYPDDYEVEGEYGLTLEKLATTPATRHQAYFILENVLRRDPQNLTIRQTLGSLAVRLGRFENAIEHLAPLRRTSVSQSDLEDTLAWCYVGLGRREQASECFRTAIHLQPDRLSSYESLAQQYLRLNRGDEAKEVMEDLIKANPRLAAAHVSRALFLEKLEQFAEAAEEMSQAATLAKEDAGVLSEAADFHLRRGRPDQARPLLTQAVRVGERGQSWPRSSIRPVLELATLECQSGRAAEAIAVLRQALSGNDPQVIALLGEMLFDQGKAGEAAQLLARLPANSPFAAYLEARRWMSHGEWIKAARRLEPLAVGSGQWTVGSEEGGISFLSSLPTAHCPLPTLFWPQRVQLSLARCYGVCGDLVRQVEASRRAVSLNPSSREARIALAHALAASGKQGEAAEEWKRLMSEAEPPAEGWTAWARALMRSEGRGRIGSPLVPRPSSVAEVEQLLTRAEQAGVDPVEVAILRAEALVLQDRRDQAETLLLEECRRLDDPTPLVIALTDLLAARERFREALSMLKMHTSTSARIARIRYLTWGGSKVPNPSGVLEEATHGLDRLAAARAAAVLRALVESARARGDLSAALEYCRRWCDRSPQDLRAFMMRLDLAERLQRDPDLRLAAEGMRRIEGDSGLRWRCAEATRLLLSLAELGPARRSSRGPEIVREARRLLEEAEEQGRWTSAGLGRVALLKGRLEEAAGNLTEALTLYLRAFDLGERGEQQTHYLVQRLLERQQISDADRVVRQCEVSGVGSGQWAVGREEGTVSFLSSLPTAHCPLPTGLARLGCEAALRRYDYLRARELAPQAIDPANHLDQLWLAEVYDKTGRQTEASVVLEQLAERSGDIADVWVALVRQLVRAGQREKAEDVLPRAQRQLSAVDDLWPLAIGQCYEALGKTEQAERTYRLAVAAAPRNPLVQRQLAAFYLAGDQPEKAEPYLEALVKSPYQTRRYSAWAGRALVCLPFDVLSLQRNPARWLRQEEELLALLTPSRDGKDTVANQRARALLIAAQPGRAEEGLRHFKETLSPGAPLTPDEQFRLAQLCELAQDRGKADELMEELLETEKDKPQYLAGRIRMLLGRDNPDDLAAARQMAKQLRELEPESERTRSLLAQCEL